MINVERILTRYRIEFVSEGPNVSTGNVNIRCPFCGSSDPSHHLGINLKRGWWGCWRNPRHRGKDFARLLSACLGISYNDAKDIIGPDETTNVDTASFSQALKSLRGTEEQNRSESKLSMPPNFHRITRKGFAIRYWDYLTHVRDFEQKDLKAIIKRYDLRYSLTGPYKLRIIFPLYMDKKLVGWTGRDITDDALVRYKSLSDNPEKIARDGYIAPINIKQTIYNYDNLTGGKALYIVEGPMDVLKLDYYGQEFDVSATGLLSTNVTDEQINLLCEVSRRYDETRLLLDAGTTIQAFDINRRLSAVGIGISKLPRKVKDPGAMTKRMVKIFLANEQKTVMVAKDS